MHTGRTKPVKHTRINQSMLTTRLEVDTMTIKAPQTQVKASLLLSGRISLASRRKRFYFYFVNYEIEANTDRINRTYPLYTLKFCRECGTSFKGRNAKTCAFKSAGINAIVLEGLVDLKSGILAQACFVAKWIFADDVSICMKKEC